MKKYTADELSRLAVYVLAALVGAFATIWGIIHDDAGLIATGLSLLGVGSFAGMNVPGSSSAGDHGAGG